MEGFLYVVGFTASQKGTFPVGGDVPGFQKTQSGSYDGFVMKIDTDVNGTYLMKLDPLGTSIEYGTYLSTSGGYPADLQVTDKGQAIIAVNGEDTLPVHPRIPGIEKEYKGNQDGYLVMFNPSGTRLEFATYIGGSKKDTLTSLALGSTGKVYVSGSTLSAEEDYFPIGKYIPGYNSMYYRRDGTPIVESFVMCIYVPANKYYF